jgi:hypothetical protein
VSIARFFIETATVETYLGTNGYGGDTFAAPVQLVSPNGCWVDNSVKLVRSAQGEQVVSNSRLYTYPANAALFTPDTRVTVDGVITRVLMANVNLSGVLKLPDHVEVELV